MDLRILGSMCLLISAVFIFFVILYLLSIYLGTLLSITIVGIVFAIIGCIILKIGKEWKTLE